MIASTESVASNKRAAIATKNKVEELHDVFSEVEDPRTRRSAHSLVEMIFIALAAAICGCNSWTDVELFGKRKLPWLRRFLKLTNGIPSHDTFGRVFNLLNEDQMCRALVRWLEIIGTTSEGRHIAIDGKSFRNSFDTATGTEMLHLVNAWCTDKGICFGQHSVEEGSNEITAVPKLLELIDINGATITLDAMHCQKATAHQIIERGADYVIAVKDNQPALHDAITEAFADAGRTPETAASKGLRTHTLAPSKGRKPTSRLNRIRRICSVMPASAALRKMLPGLKTLVCMYREQQRNDRGHESFSEHVTFFASSLPPRARDHARLIRDHWKVENQLHWSLDVTFGEDHRRNRKHNGAAISGFISRLALSILQQDTSLTKMSLRAKRKVCGWDSDSLEAVLTGFST